MNSEIHKLKKIIIFLAILLMVSIVGNVSMYIIFRSAEDKYIEEKSKIKFELLAPNIAWMNTEKFLKIQKHYSIDYWDLRERILDVLNNSSNKGYYGIYFEDLNTGAWIGINEKSEFIPASLLKLPIMIAILKKIEDGELTFEKKITLEKEDIDLGSGTIGSKGEGYQITVKDLLTYLIKESDNAAARIFFGRILKPKDWAETLIATGFLPKKYKGEPAYVTPKQYSNILRSLYYSTYLRRVFSELGLSIMSETDYNNQLPAGIPPQVRISHKHGNYSVPDQLAYHDCGIVYYPNKPYMLCIMSKNTKKSETERTIREISKIVYEYVDENQKHSNHP